MKAVRTKKHRKSGTTVATEISKVKSRKKLKEKHRKIKKKSITETGTTIGGQAGGDDVSKAASQVSKDGTKFFTVNSYFQTPSKKKKGKH